MLTPTEVAQTPKINAAVESVLQELRPSVRYIRFDIEPDWAGDLAIFFRVVLADEATEGDNLRRITRQVRNRLADRIGIPEHGMLPHVSFRGESEQAALNDPAWAERN